MLLNEIADMNIMTINNVSDIEESLIMSQRYLDGVIEQLEDEPNHYRKQATLKTSMSMFIATFSDSIEMLENEYHRDKDLKGKLEALLKDFKYVYNAAVQEDLESGLDKLKQIQKTLQGFDYI